MTEKELHRLKRGELLELLVEQGELVEKQQKELDSLREQVKSLNARLEERQIAISQSGSLAEASLKLSGIFEAAQKAADLYLDNVRPQHDLDPDYCGSGGGAGFLPASSRSENLRAFDDADPAGRRDYPGCTGIRIQDG